jgi:ABC-type transporter Mla MlaB component
MTNNLSLHIKQQILCLSGYCSFASVAKLDQERAIETLLPSLPLDVQLDLSGIENASSAILPLLLQLKRSAANQNKHLQLQAIPESLLAMIKLAELDGLLLSEHSF